MFSSEPNRKKIIKVLELLFESISMMFKNAGEKNTTVLLLKAYGRKTEKSCLPLSAKYKL